MPSQSVFSEGDALALCLFLRPGMYAYLLHRCKPVAQVQQTGTGLTSHLIGGMEWSSYGALNCV